MSVIHSGDNPFLFSRPMTCFSSLKWAMLYGVDSVSFSSAAASRRNQTNTRTKDKGFGHWVLKPTVDPIFTVCVERGSMPSSRTCEPLWPSGKGARSRDSLLVRAQDSLLKGCEFESRQEQRQNFLLQSQLCVLTLIRCPFYPRVTAVARKRPWSFCQKCRWQVTPKHAYTYDRTKSEWTDHAAVQA